MHSSNGLYSAIKSISAIKGVDEVRRVNIEYPSNYYKSKFMLVVHPKDITTSFLSSLYIGTDEFRKEKEIDE